MAAGPNAPIMRRSLPVDHGSASTPFRGGTWTSGLEFSLFEENGGITNRGEPLCPLCERPGDPFFAASYLDARKPPMTAMIGLSCLPAGSASTPKFSSAVAPRR